MVIFNRSKTSRLRLKYLRKLFSEIKEFRIRVVIFRKALTNGGFGVCYKLRRPDNHSYWLTVKCLVNCYL